MNTISITYDLKYQISFASNYQFTSDGKCFNTKTGRQIKQVLNCRSVGYCINGKFHSLSYLRKYLERIPKKEHCPF